MRLTLASKVSATIVGVLALAILSSVVALLSARYIDGLMQRMVVENLGSVEAAEELQIALMEQRGFVTSYILDEGNRAWLEELRSREPSFQHWLEQARATANTKKEHDVLAQLNQVFRRYDAQREEAIALYDRGEVEAAKRIVLQDVKSLYDQAYDLCDGFVAENQRIVKSRTEKGRNRIRRISVMVAGCVSLTMVAGAGLLWLFFHGVLVPLRRMAAEARTVSRASDGNATAPAADELRTVGLYLRTLMHDVVETRSHLERSHEQLMSAEKLALIGKLAASVAHEIRNPLTAVKMWLFSIRKAIGQDAELEHKLNIVSEEINRLESIIHNFLQFSRPPELTLKPYNVAVLIDKTLELIGPRIEQKNIRVVRRAEPGLPKVVADSEQLKQVFINLLNNAAEAMEEGGDIRISEAMSPRHDGCEMVTVRIGDSGPGMSQETRDRIFEPFFTTKDDGAGLGLCIAARIMERHGGRLVLESSTDQGTTFAVWIPAEAEQHE